MSLIAVRKTSTKLIIIRITLISIRDTPLKLVSIKITWILANWSTPAKQTYSEIWTKISLESPSSGVMNPWPRWRQKFLQVPVCNGESDASLDL